MIDYALVGSPALARTETGEVRLIWSERLGADQVRVAIEYSDDLGQWQADPGDGSGMTVVQAVTADGTRTLTGRLAEDNRSRRFVRLRAVPR